MHSPHHPDVPHSALGCVGTIGGDSPFCSRGHRSVLRATPAGEKFPLLSCVWPSPPAPSRGSLNSIIGYLVDSSYMHTSGVTRLPHYIILSCVINCYWIFGVEMIDSSVFRTRAIQQRVEYMFSVFSCCTWLQPLMGKKMVMFSTQRCRISCESIFLKAQD